MTTKLNFLHICDTAFLSNNGNLNIIGIFEKILAAKLPATHPRLTIVANIGGLAGEHNFEIKIVSPKGKEIVKINGGFTLPKTGDNFGLINSVGNLKIEEKGVYRVEVSADKKSMGYTTFNVEIVESSGI